MYTLACSSTVKLGSLVGASDRRFQGKAAPEWEGEMQLGKVVLGRCKRKSVVSSASNLTVKAKNRVYSGLYIPSEKLEEGSCLLTRHLACF